MMTTIATGVSVMHVDKTYERAAALVGGPLCSLVFSPAESSTRADNFCVNQGVNMKENVLGAVVLALLVGLVGGLVAAVSGVSVLLGAGVGVVVALLLAIILMDFGRKKPI